MASSRRGLGVQKCKVCDCIHQVVIHKEGCSYRVEPGRLMVHTKATVTFVSLVRSKEGVALWFPKGTNDDRPIHLDGQQSAHVQVGSECGVFAYAVHVPGVEGGEFAEGGSPPRMIVADPS